MAESVEDDSVALHEPHNTEAKRLIDDTPYKDRGHMAAGTCVILPSISWYQRIEGENMINPHTERLPTIKDLRVASGLTQTQLAFKAGVSPTTIANWEQNRATPMLDQLRRLCAVLGVSIDRVALTPYEHILQTHDVVYHLKAQHTADDNIWIGRCLGVDFSGVPLADPSNPYSNGILSKPMEESDPDTTSVVVPVTWKWEETGTTADEAVERLAQRITTALDRCYAAV